MTIRVALVGVDGLNAYIVKRYLALDNEFSNAIAAQLRSLVPPITAPAWVSIATGLNPAKTGVIDFLNPINTRRNEVRPVSSTVYRGFSIWDYASIAGYSVCVIDYPLLYPPYELNGIAVSGFLAPTWASYPNTLIRELYEKVGPHWEHIYFAIDKKYNSISIFLEDLIKGLERKIKWSVHLMYKDQWDLFVDVISHTDWLFHRCWHVLDPDHKIALKNSELAAEASSNEARSLVRYFLDILRKYLVEVSKNAQNIVIVSDHGFGPLNFIVNSAKLLKTLELTRFKLLAPFTNLHSITNRIRWFLAPQTFAKTPFELSIDPYDVIDYDNSIIYTLPHDELIMALYINSRYATKRDRVLRYIKRKLLILSSRIDAKIELVDLHKLYQGPKKRLLPDALLTVNNYSSYFEFKPYVNTLIQRSCKRRYTGTHRMEGVFIAKGSSFRRTSDMLRFDPRLRISLLDIAPTILQILGIPVPRYIDGLIRRDLLQGEFPKLSRDDLIKLKTHYTKLLTKLVSFKFREKLG